MNGYSKMRFISTTKSKSIDFSDIFSPPRTPKQLPDPTLTSQTQDKNQGKAEEDGGVVLSRNCSTASQRFKGDKQSMALQSAVKRAFSMRRSTSVSEGYCRIYDHNDPTLCSPIDDDEIMQTRSSKKKKKKKRGSKILRVCKSFFGI